MQASQPILAKRKQANQFWRNASKPPILAQRKQVNQYLLNATKPTNTCATQASQPILAQCKQIPAPLQLDQCRISQCKKLQRPTQFAVAKAQFFQKSTPVRNNAPRLVQARESEGDDEYTSSRVVKVDLWQVVMGALKRIKVRKTMSILTYLGSPVLGFASKIYLEKRQPEKRQRPNGGNYGGALRIHLVARLRHRASSLITPFQGKAPGPIIGSPAQGSKYPLLGSPREDRSSP
jgi:hypothetical protein